MWNQYRYETDWKYQETNIFAKNFTELNIFPYSFLKDSANYVTWSHFDSTQILRINIHWLLFWTYLFCPQLFKTFTYAHKPILVMIKRLGIYKRTSLQCRDRICYSNIL